MQVLKFGGTSVANAENINKAAQIVSVAVQAVPTVIVVSALGGVTDSLIQCGLLASAGDESYKEKLQFIEQRHLDVVKSLIPITQQSGLLSQVKTRCNEIEDICNGVFLLGELSARTRDKIVGYGELISSQIFSARLNTMGFQNLWIDSRQLIRTDSQFGFAAVDFPATDRQIENFFRVAKEKIFVLPGFIASDADGNITTMGRGGYDY